MTTTNGTTLGGALAVMVGALVALGAPLAGCDAGRAPTDLGAGGGGGSGGTGGGDSGAGGTPKYEGIGCEDAAEAGAAQPFGNHGRPYAEGTSLPNHLSQAELDGVTKAAYQAWKGLHLKEGCGEGRFYVAAPRDDDGANQLTVSEAHGYGMLVSVLMAGAEPDARAQFDGMFRFFKDHPASDSPDLMAWRQETDCESSRDSDSATDGDLDIAYALLLADKQWGSGGDIDYGAEAEKVLTAIMSEDVHPSRRFLRLGSAFGSGEMKGVTRSSDFMPGHLASFAAATKDPAWTQVLDGTYELFEAVQRTHSPEAGLLPDFIVSADGKDGAPRPPEGAVLEEETDGAYAMNACRDPWRLALHFLASGDARARELLAPLSTFFRDETARVPGRVQPGYQLDGRPLYESGWTSLAYIAPLGVAAMLEPGEQQWLNATWNAIRDEGDEGMVGSYYEDTLALLSLIAMSGNWWAPESAPCPGAG